MAWITISADDVKNHLTGAEYSAVSTKALSSGQANPVTQIIADVTQEVRGYVAGCPRNQLDATTTTVPGELKTAALDLIVMRLARRFPGLILDPREIRTKAEEAARTLLRLVAECKFGLEPPTTPASTAAPSSSAVESANAPTPRATRDNLSGL